MENIPEGPVSAFVISVTQLKEIFIQNGKYANFVHTMTTAIGKMNQVQPIQ